MLSIKPCKLPQNSLLATYHQNGAYTDCYTTKIPSTVTHSQYIQAFYTTPIFKLERLILKWAVSRPSSDAQVNLLATGASDTFAAWRVEKRCENQLLMCDYQGRTRSWFMIEPVESESGAQTRLYFGSAVVPVKNPKNSGSSPGLVFRALICSHKIYSVTLLFSARSRLKV